MSLGKEHKSARVLEEIIDIDQIDLMSPRILCQVGPLNLMASLLKFSREKEVLVTTNSCNISIISQESIRQIKKNGKCLVHTGLIVIGIKGLTRKEKGCRVLLMVLDKS